MTFLEHGKAENVAVKVINVNLPQPKVKLQFKGFLLSKQFINQT